MHGRLQAGERPIDGFKLPREGIHVALCYPNSYKVGMANLGFQFVYRYLNSFGGIRCERVFLPEGKKQTVRSIESGRPLSQFRLVAFSCHFEEDYVRIPLMLGRAGIPPRQCDRNRHHPTVVLGGAAALLNPEPLASFFDTIVSGDGEVTLPQLAKAIVFDQRLPALEEALCGLPGFYFPERYRPLFERGRFSGYETAGPYPVETARAPAIGLAGRPPIAAVIAPHAQFGEMALLEVGRGCDFGCRFCTSGYHYLPPRHADGAGTAAALDSLGAAAKVGVISSAVAAFPGIANLLANLAGEGKAASTSSLRLDRIDRDLAQALVAAGKRTATIAPETGTDGLRHAIGKAITNEKIEQAAETLLETGIENLKLYLLVGLPGETDDDVAAIPPLVLSIRDRLLAVGKKRGRAGRIVANVNVFIPKPNTPFQWAPLASDGTVARRLGHLQRTLSREPNVELRQMSRRQARIQSYLARADRRAAEAMVGGRLDRTRLDAAVPGWRQELHRERDDEEPFPWEILKLPVARSYLLREWHRSKTGLVTVSCPAPDPACHRCGAC